MKLANFVQNNSKYILMVALILFTISCFFLVTRGIKFGADFKSTTAVQFVFVDEIQESDFIRRLQEAGYDYTKIEQRGPREYYVHTFDPEKNTNIEIETFMPKIERVREYVYTPETVYLVTKRITGAVSLVLAITVLYIILAFKNLDHTYYEILSFVLGLIASLIYTAVLLLFVLALVSHVFSPIESEFINVLAYVLSAAYLLTIFIFRIFKQHVAKYSINTLSQSWKDSLEENSNKILLLITLASIGGIAVTFEFKHLLMVVLAGIIVFLSIFVIMSQVIDFFETIFVKYKFLKKLLDKKW